MKFKLLFLAALITFSSSSIAESTHPTQMKIPPKRPSTGADIIVEWMEILNDCQTDKICVEGQLYNQGKKTASQVKLRVDFGSTKYTKPRTSLYSKLDESTMAPGDRQEFHMQLNRRVTYKDKDKEKVMEVGKFNFKVIPVWTESKKK